MGSPRQARINAQMLCWGDREITRFQFRVRLFAERGLSAGQAEAWADALALRDQQLDDRRSCIECRHYVHSWRCAKRQPTLAQLQRCPSFKFATP